MCNKFFWGSKADHQGVLGVVYLEKTKILENLRGVLWSYGRVIIWSCKHMIVWLNIAVLSVAILVQDPLARVFRAQTFLASSCNWSICIHWLYHCTKLVSSSCCILDHIEWYGAEGLVYLLKILYASRFPSSPCKYSVCWWFVHDLFVIWWWFVDVFFYDFVVFPMICIWCFYFCRMGAGHMISNDCCCFFADF